MEHYRFRMYFAREREFFQYGKWDPDTGKIIRPTAKDYPMMDSLLSFLDVDVMEDDRVFREMEDAIKEYRARREDKALSLVRARLDALAHKHIFYEILRLDWLDRLERAANMESVDDFDQIAWAKELRHIPTLLYGEQQHIQELFQDVLLYGAGKESIRERAAKYFTEKKRRARGIDYFQFRQLTTVCETVSPSAFTEVLYANSIFDALDFSVRACVMEEYPVRRCKNCGKWFVLTGHQGLEYCNRPFDEKGHTCRDVGAGLTWERRSKDDLPFMAYRKEYKKRFARIKAGRITNDEFLAWGERARAKKNECDKGQITLEEFKEWLENS